MVARVVLVVLVAALIGSATYATMTGLWGESSAVISTRVGGRGVK
jgi:hypothetical protein